MGVHNILVTWMSCSAWTPPVMGCLVSLEVTYSVLNWKSHFLPSSHRCHVLVMLWFGVCLAVLMPATRPWSRRLLLGTRRSEHTHTRSLPVLSLPSQSEFMVQPSYLTSALQFSRNPWNSDAKNEIQVPNVIWLTWCLTHHIEKKENMS